MIEAIASLKAGTIIAAADAFGAKPNDSLPGGNVLSELIGGVMKWGQFFVVGGIIIGAMLWVVGSKSHNPQHASSGKMMVLMAIAAAILIGGANEIGQTFYDMGKKVS